MEKGGAEAPPSEFREPIEGKGASPTGFQRMIFGLHPSMLGHLSSE